MVGGVNYIDIKNMIICNFMINFWSKDIKKCIFIREKIDFFIVSIMYVKVFINER